VQSVIPAVRHPSIKQTDRVADYIETPAAEKTESAWQPGKTGKTLGGFMRIVLFYVDAIASLLLLINMWLLYKEEEPLPWYYAVWITMAVLSQKLLFLARLL